MSDDAPYVAMLGLMLLLPVAALIARRVPARTLLITVLAWVAIFAVGLLIVSTIRGPG